MEARLRRTPGRTYYESSIEDFVSKQDASGIVEFLTESDTTADPYELHLQKRAWENQIRILKKYLNDKRGYIIFEYVLSRVNMRIDVVLLMNGIVYSLEFKNNETTFEDDYKDQAEGYGYALKNFYEENQNKYVVPILIATKAPDSECSEGADLGIDKLFSLFLANEKKMCQYIDLIKEKYGSEIIQTEEDFEKWINSPFKPNPTIIQSARSIYMNNQVDDFYKFDASEENLRITESTVESVVKEAREEKRKIICFVSGVPGAGKTLVGLDIAGKSRYNTESQSSEAVFFSGNRSLISVLTNALGRDAYEREPEKYRSRNSAINTVKTFIQDLHAFKSEMAFSKKYQVNENVLVFDEAQRVWDADKLNDWFNERGAKDRFKGLSEADLLLDVLEKKEWGVIVALIGLGQDIYVGEDGICLWFDSLLNKHTDWQIRMSEEIFDQKADQVDQYREQIIKCPRFKNLPGLYLKTSIRTPRAKNLADFSEALLNNEPKKAAEAIKLFKDYPICVTRDYLTAEQFVFQNKMRKERIGKLCTSSSKILGKESGRFNVINNNFIHKWMLDETGRDSSNSLVYAASEFNIQGLEIDWSILGWDMDMYYSNGEWHEQRMLTHRYFRESTDTQKKHIINSYRVLLTRARKGVVIYIPKADEYNDKYGVSQYFDETYNYLKSCGIKDINDYKNHYIKMREAIRLPF